MGPSVARVLLAHCYFSLVVGTSVSGPAISDKKRSMLLALYFLPDICHASGITAERLSLCLGIMVADKCQLFSMVDFLFSPLLLSDSFVALSLDFAVSVLRPSFVTFLCFLTLGLYGRLVT